MKFFSPRSLSPSPPITMSLGARAVRALTAARRRAGEFPARNQTLSFLGPEPTGEAAAHIHVREKRKLSARLRELFVYSPALGRTVGVRVLLPGLPSESATALYLFHGGGDDFRSWTDLGAAEELTADCPYLVVMPDAGAASYSRHRIDATTDLDWPGFHTRELPTLIADLYSIKPERIAAGLSMGGYGAMKYAAWQPDAYRAAAAFSSPLDPLAAPPLFEIIALREGGAAKSLFGDLKRDRGEWLANSPLALAPNLAGTDLWFAAGSGLPDPDDDEASADTLEAIVHNHGGRFHQRLSDLGIVHGWQPRDTGGHSWDAWQRELRAWLEHMAVVDGAAGGTSAPEGATRVSANADVADGAPFTYLTGNPVFEVHGWRVEISRRRAQLLSFANVTPDGFELTGAGTFRVRTPALYHPGQQYDVAISSPLADNAYTVRADADGRLELTGRMAGALHDPIVPGKRTRHFRTWGQDSITRVSIAHASVGHRESRALDGDAVAEHTMKAATWETAHSSTAR